MKKKKKPKLKTQSMMTMPSIDEQNQLLALYNQGLFAEAAARSEALIARFPDYGIAWKVLSGALSRLGRNSELFAANKRTVELMPNDAAAHYNLGNTLRMQNNLQEAESSYRKALAINPNLAEAHYNLGIVLIGQGRVKDAETSYRNALVINPDLAGVHYNLGNALRLQNNLQEAEASYRKALAINPNLAEVQVNLGVVLMDQGRMQEAETSYRSALTINANFAEAHCNLGIVLASQGEIKEAEISYRNALDINPNFAEAYCNLGNLLKDQGNSKGAEENYRRSLEIKPANSDTHNNLGILLGEQNRFLEAEVAHRNALHYSPENLKIMSAWVFARRRLCDWDSINESNIKLSEYLNALHSSAPEPIALLATENFNPQQLLRAGRLFAEYRYKSRLTTPPLSRAISASHRKLRIGYLSSDFHGHATVYLLAGVLENRNSQAFDVYLYSYGVDQKDASRSRVENACEHFRPVRALSDEAIAQQILADEIDILVDLKGYTQGERLGITALRPAPVIVSWLGYPATLGHERLADYIIGDAMVTPLEHAEHFSETLALMPHCYQPNDDQRPVGECPSREQAGLPATGLVFCTFNQAYKITPEMFALWCRLLAAVPNSVLWLLEPHSAAQANLRREMQARGVAPERLIFAPKMDQTAHLGRLQLADLAVDTFPYTSHTTASDALWAGVPLVTKMGETFASRVAASILQTMDLAELVVTNDEDYFKIAVSLAQNPERLAAVKRKIAEGKRGSPLFDTQLFARDLERLYQAIWAQELVGDRKAIMLGTQHEPITLIKTEPMNNTLANILKLERLTEVVDIGANPIDGEPPYKPLLSAGVCRVTGFEPQESALAELLAKKGEQERYLPYAVGDGETHTLNICRASGMTSLFEPDAAMLELFAVLKPLGEVIRRVEMSTRKLDDIAEIEYLDFLKIDIQGAELAVFENGVQKLAQAVAIQTEVSFMTLYKNQPALGEIDSELRRQGFVPHCFAAVKKWPIAPCVINNDPRRPLNQLLEADIVYVRDFSKPDLMTDEQLKQLAMIVHHCYGSSDLALRCIMLLEARKALPVGSQKSYLDLLANKS
ncbi:MULTISPECIES: FkbM family methyltransferase [Methylobacter]